MPNGSKGSNGRFMLVASLASVMWLAGCGTATRAPIIDLSATPPSSSPAPVRTVGQSATQASNGSYLVQPGDTLYSIARAHGISVEALASWNQVTDPGQLQVGQVLVVKRPSAATTVKPVPATTPPPSPTQPVSPKKATTPVVQTTPSIAPKPTPEPAPVSPDAKAIQWTWPASGRIIQTFDATSKGIDISGAAGDPVRAAADGKVMYSGNGVRGLGNLLIINHQNSFITAYAHNRKLLVKTGQEVKGGTQIAEIGQTDTTSPRLHFEVRRQGTPVNPLQYLPPR